MRGNLLGTSRQSLNLSGRRLNNCRLLSLSYRTGSLDRFPSLHPIHYAPLMTASSHSFFSSASPLRSSSFTPSSSAPEIVLLIEESTKTNFGKISLSQAHSIAKEKKKILSLISKPKNNVPIYKILTSGESRAIRKKEEEKREREKGKSSAAAANQAQSRRSQKRQKDREIRLGHKISDNDLSTKIDKAVNILLKNGRVNLIVIFKQRHEFSAPLGKELLQSAQAQFSQRIEEAHEYDQSPYTQNDLVFEEFRFGPTTVSQKIIIKGKSFNKR